MADTQVLRLAIVGAAHPHVSYVLDELAHRTDVALVAVSDPDPDLAAKHAAPHGAEAYREHRRLLAAHRPDIVAVCGIYGDRAGAIVDSLDAGAHVLADKPLCTSLAELAEIEAAAARASRTVSLLLEKRHYPETLAARALLADGALGDLVQIASTGPHKLNRPSRPPWFLRRATYGGIIGDLAVHDIDLVLLLTGAREGAVSAHTDRADPEFARYGAVLLTAGAATATVEVNWLTPAASPWHGDYRMRLTGTRGAAELCWAQGRLTAVTDDRAPFEVPLPPARRPAADALAALVEGRSPEVDTAASITASRVALLAQESADTGGSVRRWSADVSPAD
ncbi:Gfo/Idh/MocA family protein [Actinacidiphila acidipaludis]|uniref:Gfo/Idh/MocA family oxidoreductase n=1 Tax=Actinacidiphila acidipaludis TaxID=2873382 RepID=A0ABS7QAV4_9ACTN|nr:Gfo/Idh/MocA family oxidoreductase [Streptomyces acidipaludis]MBY8880300.1 Gfo/Idh/MocA family oxidoreductase [Streptomyces acidipaludis]